MSRNRILCNKCLDVIESKSRHDFIWCSCGSVAVDGGMDYMKRCGNSIDMFELGNLPDETVEEILGWKRAQAEIL